MSRNATRIERLRQAMGQEGIELFLAAEPANVTYLTGFSGDSSHLLLSAREAWLITDGRYTEQAAAEAPHCEVVRNNSSLAKCAAELANASGRKTLGFEPNVLTVAAHGELTKELQGVEAVPKKGLVEKLRQVKDAEELAAIRRAAALADAAFLAVRTRIEPDQSEAHVANALEFEMRRLGARRGSFEAIVAARQRSSLPHARATEAPIAPGDPVLVDWGAELGLYCSDCTRMVFLSEPDAAWAELYELVREAQERAIAAIRPGVQARDVDAAARVHIAQAGYYDAFKHGLGHGVGLRVHEGPTLSSRSEDKLTAGMVVTVEPGVYVPGWGGIRIEDLVAVGLDGPEILSSLPKTLKAAIL